MLWENVIMEKLQQLGLLDVSIVIAFSVLYTLLDRKYPQFRIRHLYRENFWQSLGLNLTSLGVVYIILFYIFG